jgi:hypothetical protein
MAFKNKSRKNKNLKNKKLTRKGGFFNYKKTKSDIDNIKDWYLYRKTHPEHYTYNMNIRYPGYYNIGMKPTPGFISNKNSIETACGMKSMTSSPFYMNSSEDVKNNLFNEGIELCAANRSGDNKFYYDQFWKCKYDKNDKSTHYNPSKNWVNYTTDNSENRCNKVYPTETFSLLPDPHEILIGKDDYAPPLVNGEFA